MRTPCWLLVASLVVGVPSVGNAQSRADSVLIGVREVDAQVTIDWDERISSITKANFENQMEFAFKLELRKLGIIVSAKADNFLWCGLNVLAGDGEIKGIVIYSLRVDFDELLPIRRVGSTSWATTWNASKFGTVGESKFATGVESMGKYCAEKFGNAWLAANPKR